MADEKILAQIDGVMKPGGWTVVQCIELLAKAMAKLSKKIEETYVAPGNASLSTGLTPEEYVKHGLGQAVGDDEQFERNIKILSNLLEYPQEGLTTRHEARLDLAKKIFQFLWDKGFRPRDD